MADLVSSGGVPAFWTWPRTYSQQPAGAPRNAPGLVLVLGVDGTSAGVAVHYWLPTAAQYPKRERLFERRWAEPAMTPEECVRIALRALQELHSEMGQEAGA